MPSADELKQQGNAALAANDQQAAHKCYTEAIALDPENHVLYSNRAAANANMGQWADALSDSQRCIELAPNWPKGHVRAGAAHYALDQYAESVAAYTRALELNPSDKAVQTALEDAKKGAAKKELEAQLMPAVMSFAQSKQAGQLLLQKQDYAAAATEYRGALKAMSDLMEKLPAAEGGPMIAQLQQLRRSMEAELVAAVQKLA